MRPPKKECARSLARRAFVGYVMLCDFYVAVGRTDADGRTDGRTPLPSPERQTNNRQQGGDSGERDTERERERGREEGRGKRERLFRKTRLFVPPRCE